MRRLQAGVTLLAAMAATLMPATASAAGATLDCARYDVGNFTPDVAQGVTGTGPLRVFAVQFRQDIAYVESYRSFDEKIECLTRRYVGPHWPVPGKVGMVVFNEDIGLATLAIGSRGAAARAFASLPAPGDAPALFNRTGQPPGAAAALGMIAAGYARQLGAYRARFPTEDPRKAVITAATDTFVRGFMTTFSTLARRWGVYVVASNNQADFHYSTAPSDVAQFGDPDLAPQYANGTIKGVWVASGDQAWNQAFLFAPSTRPGWQPDCDPAGRCSTEDPSSPEYDPRSNLVFTNRKTPLTDTEKVFLGLDEGDLSPANTGPVELPGLPGFKFGFAISLPAFQYGNRLGEPAPSPVNGTYCVRPDWWMRCLHERGVNTVIQPEANPGPWAHYGADGNNWQALTWGMSTLRAVIDPTVPGFRYLVCPHLVGNLVDLPFDGQTTIVQRGLVGAGRHYAGAGTFVPGSDDEWTRVYTGHHPEFLALAPWVLPDAPDHDAGAPAAAANRAVLQGRADDLQAGSLSPESNRYLETAVLADLTTPR